MPFNNLATLYLCPAFSLNFSSCTCDSRFQYKLGCSPSPLIVTIRNSMECHVFWIPGSLKTFMFHYYCEGGQPEVQDSLFQYESAHISTKQTLKWQQKQKQKWPQKYKNTKEDKEKLWETNRICPSNCDTKDVGSGRHIQMILLILLAFLTEDQRILLQRFWGIRRCWCFAAVPEAGGSPGSWTSALPDGSVPPSWIPLHIPDGLVFPQGPRFIMSIRFIGWYEIRIN